MSISRLILASASPRRQSLLREAGYCFVVDPANIREDEYPAALRPGELAVFLASAKAQTIADQYVDDVVLGADTIVALGSTVLGKPADAADARRILGMLSGTTHEVITGVAVVGRARGFLKTVTCVSSVQMRGLSRDEIDAYIAGGEWEGKAGAYGIQDQDPFVMRISGSLTNIVGLPMEETGRLLGEAGIVPGKMSAGGM